MYKNSFPIILRGIENFVKWKLVVWNLYYIVWKQIRVTAAASLMVYLDEILLFIARVNFKFTTNSIIRCTIIQPLLSRHILKTKICVLQRTWFTNSLHLLVTYNQPTTNLVQQTSILRLYSVSFSEEQLFKKLAWKTTTIDYTGTKWRFINGQQWQLLSKKIIFFLSNIFVF